MDKNIPILITKVNNGFIVEPGQDQTSCLGTRLISHSEINVFYTLDHMHTFLRNHFKEAPTVTQGAESLEEIAQEKLGAIKDRMFATKEYG